MASFVDEPPSAALADVSISCRNSIQSFLYDLLRKALRRGRWLMDDRHLAEHPWLPLGSLEAPMSSHAKPPPNLIRARSWSVFSMFLVTLYFHVPHAIYGFPRPRPWPTPYRRSGRCCEGLWCLLVLNGDFLGFPPYGQVSLRIDGVSRPQTTPHHQRLDSSEEMSRNCMRFASVANAVACSGEDCVGYYLQWTR